MCAVLTTTYYDPTQAHEMSAMSASSMCVSPPAKGTTPARSGGAPLPSPRWFYTYIMAPKNRLDSFVSDHVFAQQEAVRYVVEEGCRQIDAGIIGINDADTTAWDFVELPGEKDEKTSLKPPEERWGHGSVKMAGKHAQQLTQEGFSLCKIKPKDGGLARPVSIILKEADIRAVFTFAMDRVAWEVSGKTGTVWKLLAKKFGLPLKGFEIERDQEYQSLGPEKRVIIIRCDSDWEAAILRFKKRVYLPVGKLEFRYKQEGANKKRPTQQVLGAEAAHPQQKRQRTGSADSPVEIPDDAGDGNLDRTLAGSVENLTVTD